MRSFGVECFITPSKLLLLFSQEPFWGLQVAIAGWIVTAMLTTLPLMDLAAPPL